MTVELQTHATGGGRGFALQVGLFTPPLRPIQDHVHGPDPDTGVGVPVVQRFEIGVDGSVWPFDIPHTPGIGVAGVGPLQVALHFPG